MNRMFNRRKRRKQRSVMIMNKDGFTFLELIVTVAIIAILATIVGVKVIPALGKSKTVVASAQIANLEKGLKLYRLDAGLYPTQAQGLQALCEVPKTPPIPLRYSEGGYLEKSKVPKDPWGREYIYVVPGLNGEPYELLTYGADGESGGEGEDADISSSM